jgi:peptide deformylase
MAETMYANQGIGLAANRWASWLRLVTVVLSGPDKREELVTLINPEIVAAEGETETEEGCLSVRDYGPTGASRRCSQGRGPVGQGCELDAEGLLAVACSTSSTIWTASVHDRISRLKAPCMTKG